MPVDVTFAFLILTCFFGLFFGCGFLFIEGDRRGIWGIVAGIMSAILFPILIFGHASLKGEGSSQTVTPIVVSGVEVIIVDKQPVNVTEKFGRVIGDSQIDIITYEKTWFLWTYLTYDWKLEMSHETP